MRFLEKAIDADLGLLILRIGLGVVFIVNGASKISNMDGFVGFITGLGLAAFWAYVVAWVELLGGIAILVGFLSSWGALLLAIDMLMAIYLVKFQVGFLRGGYQFELMLLLALIALIFTGPGRYALMGMMKGDMAKM